MGRYKSKRMNNVYDLMYRRGRDERSSLYNTDGSINRGTPPKEAFWNGYNNVLRKDGKTPYLRNSMAHAAYMAGRAVRKLDTTKPGES